MRDSLAGVTPAGLRSAGVTGIGVSIPAKILNNHDLEKMVDTSDEWITSRTGISERRILEDDRSTSDIAAEAAQNALVSAGVRADQVDLVIVATCTPDMIFPATASLVQDRIGASKAAAFDLSAACSGLIYGMAVASQFVATGVYNTVLVIGAEALSRITDWTDRSTCVLFGDGASAVVIQPTPEGRGFLSFYLGSDGSGGEFLKIEAGGSRRPASLATVQERRHTIKMCGAEVFRFAVTVIPEAAQIALDRAGLTIEDIDLFVPHQANDRIIDSSARRLGIPSEKVFSNVRLYGNTSAASIGIALSEARDTGRLKTGDAVLLVGFGAGLSWASSVLRWSME
ncbi:MAG TPA: beta-ketoacyl-ACP synthase III [Armatimonadota bacterium]|nr:beta-ketoacyl-ACP synthase III [Armatimonadota bacterium]